VSIGETFQMDVSVDQSGPCTAVQADYLCAATGGCPRAIANCQDPRVDASRHLRRAACEEYGLIHRP
jgi:hypothetical protein